MSLSSPPCFKKTFPDVWLGLIPTPSLVMMADVCAGTLNSSAAYLSTAVNGASSGTFSTLVVYVSCVCVRFAFCVTRVSKYMFEHSSLEGMLNAEVI